MIDLQLELKNLENSQNTLSQSVSRLEGQKSLLTQQIKDSELKSIKLEESKINETKAVELLHCVQRSTRDRVKEAFENTVTFALKSIYQADYRFQLEFGQKGNLGFLDFKLKSPENEGYLDLEDCTAGGSFDVISLALRFVLLQVMSPRVEGMVVIDEGTKMLSRNFRFNEFQFYEAMSKKLNRQLILITHSQELLDLTENKIKIGE